MATALTAILPELVYSQIEEETEGVVWQESQALSSTRPVIPPYGQRRACMPMSQDDYGDGGAYPECHIAQYLLDMVQSQFNDLVPIDHRTDMDKERSMEGPSEEDVQATTERTLAALEKLVNGKIKAAQPKNVLESQGKTNFIRYTPGQQQGSNELKQRIIKMTEVVEDPLEPPRFKQKKIPRGPPRPPAPVLRSPPRKATAQEQKEWMIPPVSPIGKITKVSQFRWIRGWPQTVEVYKILAPLKTVPRHYVHINDNVAKFSEALFIANRHAREEVRQRAMMQQKLAQKEKASQEEHLRMLAQRAREERGGLTAPATSKPSADGQRDLNTSLAAYGSDSGSKSEEEEEKERGEEEEEEEKDRVEEEEEEEKDRGEDEEAAKLRDEMRRENRHKRQRDMGMSNMGTEQRAKMLARQQNRDISEKIALGLAKPTLSKASLLDSGLFNEESLTTSFGDDDSYGLYDRPLFHGSSAAAAIYKARGNIADGNEESFGGGTEEGISKVLDNDRFGLARPRSGFEGASDQSFSGMCI